jgi:hypothetical protein
MTWSAIFAVAVVALLVLYLTRHQPIARLPLPDGTELRLEYVTYGTEHRIPGAGRFRAWLSRQAQRWPQLNIPEYAAEYLHLEDEPQVVLWFTIFDPKSGTYSAGLSGLDIKAVNAPGYLASLHDDRDGSQPQPEWFYFATLPPMPNRPVTVNPYERRNPSLRVQVRIEAMNWSSEIVVANPAATTSFPEWQAEALPQTSRIGELDVVLQSLSVLTRDDGAKTVLPRVDVLQRGQSAPGLRFDRWLLTDATGNTGTVDVPPPLSERAWKMRTMVWRTGDYPFAANEGLMLGPVPMPGGGKFGVFPLPEMAANHGLRLAILLGPGWYVWKDGVFLEARGAVKPEEVATIRNRPDLKDALFINALTSIVVLLYEAEAGEPAKWSHAGLAAMAVRTLWGDHAYGLRTSRTDFLDHSFSGNVRVMVYEIAGWKGWPPAEGTAVQVQTVPVRPERVEFLIAPPSLPGVLLEQSNHGPGFSSSEE